MATNECFSCAHWFAHEGEVKTTDHEGTCKRFPPVLVPMALGFVCDYNDNPDHDEIIQALYDWRMWKQPTTTAEDACGEWKERREI